ncbi:hypothetical protein OSTOST_10174 [Ostertagia ostertagi]
MAAVGIFCERDRHLSGATNGLAGLLYSGDFTLLGVQLLCTLTVLVYSATFGLLALVLISKSPLGLRVTDYEEQIGADVIEHGLAGTNVARYSGATNGLAGLLYSGDFTLLGVQLLCTLTVLVYSATFGLLALVLISKSPLGLRVTDYEEQIGADVIEHGLAGTNVARYVLEKPLSTRTFQTVTKAITKWKMLAKTKSRSKRMEQARQKRLTEDQAFTATDNTAVSGANGVPLTGNGAVHRRKTSVSVAEVAAAMSPRANGVRPSPYDVDVEAQAHAPQSASLRRTSDSSALERPASSSKSTRGNSPRRTESLGGEPSSQLSRASTTNAGSEPRPGDRPVTASHIAMTVTPSRPNPVGKFVRSPLARALTPPEDISLDSEEETSGSSGPLSRNNKVAPQ